MSFTIHEMIHPTAIIVASSKVPASCEVGAYSIIGADVELGEHCEIGSHVTIHGPTKIGNHNRIFSFAAVGCEPQDLTFKREKTKLQIGDHNVIREYVTISRGTTKGGGITRIGSHTLIMAYAHIAHDCTIADHVILANAATLAGHISIEEWAVVGALCPVHQFVRIGAHAYIGGGTTITQDVLPFTKTVARREVATFGVNALGLERRGFSKDRIQKLQRAYKTIRRNNNTQALEILKAEADSSEDVAMMIKFIETSERGIIR